MKIVFVHLDLGIGGAEMLVVNAAVAAQEAGHDVRIYTSHHDPDRCFRETTGEGALAGTVRVCGDWLPRHLFAGKFTTFCAIVRMIWLSLCVLLAERCVDVIFCDGVSAPVPLLRMIAPVLFYCHFPDKLLCVARDSLWKRVYRWPLDIVEELTTGCATSLAVNSKFTASIFREAFPRIGKNYSPSGDETGTGTSRGGDRGRGTMRKMGSGRGEGKLQVLYPPTNVNSYPERGPGDSPSEGRMGPVVSLNRFERKKGLPLAIMALDWAVKEMGTEKAFSDRGLRMIIAGGYDERVQENVEHLRELKELARKLDLEHVVEFRPNIGDEERSALLREASCVLYTPSNEHFGIVPVEAMCSGAPVVAVNSGGPLETVVDGATGFLCPPTKEAFGSAIVEIACDPALAWSMGKEGRRRVQERFSMESFAQTFEASLTEVAELGQRAAQRWWINVGFALLAALPVAWTTLGGAKGFDS